MELVIKELSKDEYKGRIFQVKYETEQYYDVDVLDKGFQLNLVRCEQVMTKGFPMRLFEDRLEEPVAFGAFLGEWLLGFAEGSRESWHHVFRISNLFVDEKYRKQEIGEKLLKHIIAYAKNREEFRGIVLETHTCNCAAIALYEKTGFQLSRIDICEYTNQDIANHEVRIDMFYRL